VGVLPAGVRDCFRHEGGIDAAVGPSVLADLASRLERAADAGERVGNTPGSIERLAAGLASATARDAAPGFISGP